MLLAGDVGGTKTLLGLFDAASDDTGARPRQVFSRSYPTSEFSSFTAILAAFARDAASVGQGSLTIDAVAVGVAGPVVEGRATVTNIGWDISVAEIAAHLGTPRVRLLNDLEAMATSVEALEPAELETLQEGTPDRAGNAAVISAGTGLGSAYLHRIGGKLLPVPCEGGHADFAARTDREIDLLRMLRDTFGRASVEHVLSGPGILNLHRLTHAGHACAAVPDIGAAEAPALVTKAALAGTCASCAEALDLFVEAYGAEAGNLAVRGVATGGIYVGGGIAPKILPALQDGRFMRAFLAKTPMDALVARIPVRVILNPDAGLLGAAVAAAELLSDRSA